MPELHRIKFVHHTALLVCSMSVLSGLVGCQRGATSDNRPAAAQRELKLAAEGEPAVELAVNYGDGVEKRFARIPFKEGMTVLGALQHAENHPRGITFVESGSGESALLTRIDDLANQTSADGKNWLYRVNGKLATKSFDAYVLSAGDVILWSFEKYE